jgi:energy-coupling factor transporter ATP-binding protein EcfA2
MYSYKAYGLEIHSELPLPELIGAQQADADVTVKFQALPNSPFGQDDAYHSYQLTDDGLYLFWQNVGTFLIREGSEILIDSAPEADHSRLRLFILGAAIGTILCQRGFLVLHASAIAISGQAVIFIGHKGQGKSTLAATLHKRGHSLLADDVVALTIPDSGIPVVHSAFPQLKLWPDAVASLGDDPNTLPYLVPHLEKRDRRIVQGFIEHPVPLQQIYVLGKGELVEIETLPPQDLLGYLIQHSYIARFGETLLQAHRMMHFRQITQLAQRVPIHRLSRPPELSLLSTTAQLIESSLLAKPPLAEMTH